jgi:hypothetical protein
MGGPLRVQRQRFYGDVADTLPCGWLVDPVCRGVAGFAIVHREEFVQPCSCWCIVAVVCAVASAAVHDG